MEVKWYIDSWDPLEGLVFASHRASISDIWDVEGIQTVRMAAPYFEPENVSRAIAFGAAQRGAQEQFSIDGELESGFDTLELLRLFVRRTYLGGGSGSSGNDDDGAPLPPAPDGNEPEVDWPSLKDGGENSDFQALMSDFQKLTVDERGEELFDFLIYRQESSLKDACKILREAANVTAIVHSPAQRRLLAIAHELYPSAIVNDFWYFAVDERATLSLALDAPLPENFARKVGLPQKIVNMIDALSFLAADRRFLDGCSVKGVLPLLLAVSANFCFPETVVYRHWHDAGTFIQRCCAFIAEWLPFDELPVPLADVVSDWNGKGVAAQRGF